MSPTNSSQSLTKIHIEILPPPAKSLTKYNLYLPASEQLHSASIPQTFLDSASIREAVFVREQGLVPLEHHVNAEDGRAYHFVAYFTPGDESLGAKIPVGTLRVLPPPHHPHPEPWSIIITPKAGRIPALKAEEIFGEKMAEEIRKGQQRMRKTSWHDGTEGWLQVARASVLKEWRGKGVADLLVAEVVRWAGEEYVPNEQLEDKAGSNNTGMWKGLLMCNAREEARRMWERNGFREDVGMGRWIEVGVELFGMARRVSIVSSSIL
jgi:GNAT superfamily N-acetyltransferase